MWNTPGVWSQLTSTGLPTCSMVGITLLLAPEYANTLWCNSASKSASVVRAERIGPTLSAEWHWKTANRRVSPPSTCSCTTMSAALSPACGRAGAMLSIFTASAGRFASAALAAGWPVRGHRGPATARWLLVVGAGLVVPPPGGCPPDEPHPARPADRTRVTRVPAVTVAPAGRLTGGSGGLALLA